ncbi:hypothetical protein Ccar_13890 [Clostridium carboxidivorans P7]|uniref:Uncharacterized protein n=1 Tax=Clostridium carboxidivorans P7 TaxID=536227 RepID=C6Q2Y8_9CLOT|nr:hypothetical protein Ccar_13890 [Clostridium carboxidivorans P7]EET84144.1 hypothetical protein CcarbDRAFT_5407 [Clostridium carboxidivorans P7]
MHKMDSFLVFIILTLSTIIISFIGVIKNMKLLIKKKSKPIHIVLLIICTLIFLFFTCWLLIILSFQSYNPDSILYKIFVKP